LIKFSRILTGAVFLRAHGPPVRHTFVIFFMCSVGAVRMQRLLCKDNAKRAEHKKNYPFSLHAIRDFLCPQA